jgi:hypothetical protein
MRKTRPSVPSLLHSLKRKAKITWAAQIRLFSFAGLPKTFGDFLDAHMDGDEMPVEALRKDQARMTVLAQPDKLRLGRFKRVEDTPALHCGKLLTHLLTGIAFMASAANGFNNGSMTLGSVAAGSSQRS